MMSRKVERCLQEAVEHVGGFELIDIYQLSEEPERYFVQIQFMRMLESFRSVVPVPMHAAICSRQREILDIEVELSSANSAVVLRLKHKYPYEQAIPQQASACTAQNVDVWVNLVLDGVELNFRAEYVDVKRLDTSGYGLCLLAFLAQYFAATTETYRAIFAGRGTHSITGHA